MSAESSGTRRVGAAIAAASILGSLTACGSDDDSEATTPNDSTSASTAGAATGEFRNLADDESIRTKEYVGAVPDTEAYVAFAISRAVDNDALAGGQAYFCDGASVAKWFSLTPRDGALEFVAADGQTFVAEIADDGSISATTAIAGADHSFTASEVPADGEAGLYLADHVIDPDLALDERGGWIVLADGTQRGAIKGGSTILPGSPLTLSTSTVSVSGRNILLRAISEIIGLDKK